MAEPKHNEDFALLDAWGQGDRKAARELLQRYTGPLVRFFERKCDGPIEDLVQATLEAAIAGKDRFRREAGFRAFIFGIARHILFAQLRAKHRVHGELDMESSCLAELAPSPSQIVDQKRERRVLLAALRQLGVETQVLLELYHFQRLTGPELAEVLGIPERTVRSRLHRAHEALRESITKVAESPELLASSWADFEGWAQALPPPRQPTPP
ncbi:MAG TPA: sigma-70 family RNA polymerase sigma factor [Nannocystaceae bacterium]|nr:sigma-70 family RNA polymerase sigma factor [Nannocystaceae bacterium]